jgi:hypothetical protein
VARASCDGEPRVRASGGGARVITYYAAPDLPVFLIAVFAKGGRANLSGAERNELREVLANLATEYREGDG